MFSPSGGIVTHYITEGCLVWPCAKSFHTTMWYLTVIEIQNEQKKKKNLVGIAVYITGIFQTNWAKLTSVEVTELWKIFNCDLVMYKLWYILDEPTS